jgi:hypothetical protein
VKYRGSFSFAFCLLLSAVLLSAALPSATAQTLFDPSLGLPEAQGWAYGAAGSATKTLVNNSVLFDTTTTVNTEAGWSEITAADLNRTNGFTLLFTVLVNSEVHVSNDRAGFSLIVIADDKRGIELAFWTNTIFAQTDTPLFTHGEDANYSTTGAFVNYALSILATNYILRADGAVILSGPVRNYTAFNGFPNPYSTPNLIFFGDDTTSASASINVRSMALVLPPKLTMPSPGIVSWTGVSNQTYHVQTSTNLINWVAAGASTSQNNTFLFTNTSPASQFFRVVYP